MKIDKKIKLNKKDLEKGLRFPLEISDELAELVGIHFGDGNMQNKFNYTYRLLYTCNISEKQYAIYIINKFKKLFNVALTVDERYDKSSIDLYIYSKSLCQFFNMELGIPYSPKENLKIPSLILNKKEHIVSFLRGLFDTDGCVILQRDRGYKYILTKISMKDKNFAKEILNSLSLVGIQSFITKKKDKRYCSYDVVMRNKHAKNFFKIIGSRNQKNIQKFESLS